MSIEANRNIFGIADIEIDEEYVVMMSKQLVEHHGRLLGTCFTNSQSTIGKSGQMMIKIIRLLLVYSSIFSQ